MNFIIDHIYGRDERKEKLHPALEAIFQETNGLEQLASVFAMIGDAGDVEEMEKIRDELWSTAKKLEEDLNQQIAAEMESVTLDLSGSDMLDYSGDGGRQC